jgi:uncharacterized repeat protein (TIGR01451 family)
MAPSSHQALLLIRRIMQQETALPVVRRLVEALRQANTVLYNEQQGARIIAGVLVKNTLYLTCVGAMSAYIMRNEKVAVLLQAERTHGAYLGQTLQLQLDYQLPTAAALFAEAQTPHAYLITDRFLLTPGDSVIFCSTELPLATIKPASNHSRRPERLAAQLVNSTLRHQRGEVVYRLQRGAVTPSSSGLFIHKQGPAQAAIHDLIRYDLAVTNRTTTTLTNLLITDTIPLHASYIAGGTRNGNQLYWHVATLATGATITNIFVVTATQTITNRDYGVRAGGGLSAKGTTAVVTRIRRPDEPPLAETIIHPGGTISWRYQGQAGQMPINPVYNPSYSLFLPLTSKR